MILEISIILAHSLCGIPKMWKEVLKEEVFEYHGEKGFFIE
jgi:hypothetical protein